MVDERDTPFGDKLLRMTERPADITDNDELVLRTFTAAMEGVFDSIPNHLKPSVAVSLICNMCGGCNNPLDFWNVIKQIVDDSMKLILAMREGEGETKQ